MSKAYIIICFLSLSLKIDRNSTDDELMDDVTDSLKVDVHEKC
ncbi:hypothetical protein [Psychroflexus curvus]|nr:hypothetical protein [Psychroflexus curvus]